MRDDAVRLGVQFAHQIQAATEALMLGGMPQSLSEMEERVRKMLLEIGRFQLSAWLALLDGSYPASQIKCRCGGESEYQYKREGVLHTSIGTLSYKRAYYVCPHCHQGTYPLDEQLGLRAGEMSAELESLAGMMGAQLPFEKGSDLFAQLTLVGISPQSMDKATQAMGREMQALEAEWLQSSQAPETVQAALQEPESERLYGAIDAVKVHTEEQRHPEDNGWRDLKVNAWFHTDAKPPAAPDDDWAIAARDITYHCDITDAQTFGDLLWATGLHRHALRAKELVILGDGADWIWNLVAEHFPHAVQIVDWFHAAEHLAQVAQAAFPEDGTEQGPGQTWLKAMRNALWQGEVETVVAACTQLANQRQGGEVARKAAAYFHAHRQRMRYADFRRRGFQIGSGTIESACKQFGDQRLKVPGATWSLNGARLTAKARAAWLSNLWDVLALRRCHRQSFA